MRIRKNDQLNSVNQFVKEYVEISQENLHVNTSFPMQVAIRALTLSVQTLSFKSSVIFYILYSRVSEVVSNFKSAVDEMLQHYLYQKVSIEMLCYTHMLQSIEERLRHCNVLTKNWCLICTTHNDKVERRKFLAHCKGK